MPTIDFNSPRASLTVAPDGTIIVTSAFFAEGRVHEFGPWSGSETYPWFGTWQFYSAFIGIGSRYEEDGFILSSFGSDLRRLLPGSAGDGSYHDGPDAFYNGRLNLWVPGEGSIRIEAAQGARFDIASLKLDSIYFHPTQRFVDLIGVRIDDLTGARTEFSTRVGLDAFHGFQTAALNWFDIDYVDIRPPAEFGTYPWGGYGLLAGRGGVQIDDIVATARPTTLVANHDRFGTNEDQQLSGNLLQNDLRGGGQQVNVSIVSGPSFGTLWLNWNGQFTYRPNQDYFNSGAPGAMPPEGFVYRISDSFGNSAFGTVRIEVAHQYDPVVGVSDVYTLLPGSVTVPVQQGVLANDRNPDRVGLSATLASAPARGALSLNSDGSFTYVREPGDTASVGFSYRVNGGAPVQVMLQFRNWSAPASQDVIRALTADNHYLFGISDFPFGDLDGNALAGVVITSLPMDGDLLLSGQPIAVGQEVAAADILAGNFRYVRDPGQSASHHGDAGFTFQVRDDGNIAEGGANLDLSANVFATKVNIAPGGTNGVRALTDHPSYTVTLGDFGFTDGDGDQFEAVVISTLPVDGTLRLHGDALLTGQEISRADILSGALVYWRSEAQSASHHGNAGFAFQVRDDGGHVRGSDLDPTPNVILSKVNQAPSRGPWGWTDKFWNQTSVFDTGDFGFSDLDGDQLKSLVITQLTEYGRLLLDGKPVTAGQEISAAQIDAGLFTFEKIQGEYQHPYDANHFAFRLRDDGGSLGSGEDLSAEYYLSHPIAMEAGGTEPVFGAGAYTGALTEQGPAATLFISGQIAFSDALIGDTHDVVPEGVAVGTVLGRMQVVLDSGTSDNGSGGRVTWTYQVDPAAVAYLREGETRLEGFVITLADGEGQFVRHQINVTITGTNHDAVIDGDVSADLDEDSPQTNVAQGSLTVFDVDTGQDMLVSQSDVASLFGRFGIEANGEWIYTLDRTNSAVQALAAGQTLIDAVSVQSVDGTAGTSIMITIHGTNDLPNISGVAIGAASEDDSLPILIASGALVIADIDEGESSFIVQSLVTGSYGDFTLAADGAWTYAAANSQSAIQQLGAGQSLTDRFTAVSADGSASHTVTVTISGTNDVPIIGGTATAIALEDAASPLSASGMLTIADVDQGQSVFAPQAWAGANYGTFTLAANGTWTYAADNAQPAIQQLGAGQSLTDSFTAVSVDGSASRVVTVTIIGTNEVPTISGTASASVTEDATSTLVASGTLTIADGDQDQSSFAPQTSAVASYGAFTLAANGAWTYVADNAQAVIQQLGYGQSLTDSFTAFSVDGSASRIVTVTINGVNDAAVIGGVSSVSVVEDSAMPYLEVSGALAIADADQGQSSFVARPLVAATYGSFALAADGTWTYAADNAQPAIQQLAAGATLTDSFTAVSLDGSASRIVTVTIVGANDVPTIGGVDSGSAAEDASQPDLTASGALTIVDVDQGQSAFAVQANVAGSNGHGAFALAADGAWFYAAANSQAAIQGLGAGEFLTDSFTAVSLDGSASRIVTVTIVGANDAPNIADPIPDQHRLEDQPITFQVPVVTFADLDGDTLAYSATLANGAPLPAWLVFDAATRTFSGTPPLNLVDKLSLVVVARDAETSASDVFLLQIAPVNDAPGGFNRGIAVDEDTSIALTLDSFAYADVDGHGLFAVRIASLPAKGALTLDGAALVVGQTVAASDIAAGKLVFTPAPNDFGAPHASFDFQVVDDGDTANGGANVDPTPNRITFYVALVNDAPTGAADSYDIAEDALLTVGLPGVLANDGDSDGDRLTALLIEGPAHGASFALNADGSFSYRATTDYAGPDSFRYRTSDGFTLGDIVTVILNVLPVDDAPLARPDAFTTNESAMLAGSVFADNGSGPDLDFDGPAIAVGAINGSAAAVGRQLMLASGALLTLNVDGTFVYDPNGKFDELAGAASGASNTEAEDSFIYAPIDGAAVTVRIRILGESSPEDELDGGPGDDNLVGGSGNDSFFLDDGGDDHVEAGAGNDGLYFGGALDGQDEVDGGGGIDSLALQGDYPGLTLGEIIGIEVLVLLSGTDGSFGDDGGNHYDYDITTNNGNVAPGGTLTVVAGGLLPDEDLAFDGSAERDGNFRIFAGQGDDELRGGAGADGFFFGAEGNLTGDDIVQGGAGADSLALRGNYVGEDAIVFQNGSVGGIEVLVFLSGHSNEYGGLIDLAGFDYDVTLADGNLAGDRRLDVIATSLRANESLRFDGRLETDGNFRILSGAGGDTLYGGFREDSLYGGLGADLLDGWLEADTYLYRFANESTAASRDRIVWGAGDKLDLSMIDANSNTAADDAFAFIGTAAFTGTAGQLRYSMAGPNALLEGDVNGDGLADLVIQIDNHVPVAPDFVL